LRIAAVAILLIRCVQPGADRLLAHWARVEARWQIFDAIESDECYLFGSVDTDHAVAELPAIRRRLAREAPATSVTRLDPLLDVPGASAGVATPFRYIVETDVVRAQEAEFNRWYDREHLPGLAAVPGTAHATRYRDPVAGPRYHACYDIATSATVGSPPWLAVRATPWSDRVRPAFRNTKRTLFRRRSA
jgi:hypothetical protein